MRNVPNNVHHRMGAYRGISERAVWEKKGGVIWMSGEKCGKAKNHLQQIRLCDTHINNKIAEVARLKELVTNITTALKEDVVSGSGSKDRLGDTVAKIVDLQDEINKAIDEYADKKRAVCEIIEALQNPEQIAVLHKRYVEDLTWEQIACDMNMSYRNVCYIHGRALQAVERLMDEKYENFRADIKSLHTIS